MSGRNDQTPDTLSVEPLRAEVARLRAENGRLSGENAALSGDVREANKEARDRRPELKALASERDRYRAEAADDPGGLRARVAALSGELREIRHRAAFDRLAGEAGVKDPSKREAAWSLSGYRPEADDVDDAGVAGVI